MLTSIFDKVHQKHQAIFTDDHSIATDSFAMLAQLITDCSNTLKGGTIENHILAISDFASFKCTVTDTTYTYMANGDLS